MKEKTPEEIRENRIENVEVLLTIVFALILAINLTSAYYSGETISYNHSDFDLFYISDARIELNTSYIPMNWTNETIKIFIPEDFTGNFRVYIEGYNDKQETRVVDTGGGGGSGGNSYAPKKILNQTIFNQTLTNSTQFLENQTNPEFTTPTDSQSLFSRFWDWLVNLFRRLFK